VPPGHRLTASGWAYHGVSWASPWSQVGVAIVLERRMADVARGPEWSSAGMAGIVKDLHH